MKIIKNLEAALFCFFIFLFAGCSPDELLTDSQVDFNESNKSELDLWINSTYVQPYNIMVQYKWNQNFVKEELFVVPPSQDKVKPVLEIIKKTWIDSYEAAAGKDFVKRIAPREFFLSGGANLEPSGIKILGFASEGMRIVLFEVDNILLPEEKFSLKEFLHTLQHEYIHILNQTKPYDRKAWALITPVGYSSDWYQYSNEESKELGFISNYARMNYDEDFAEMASGLLVVSKEDYEANLNTIQDGKAIIALKKKEALVVLYFKKAFNIDFYKLRDETVKNITAVMNRN